jgi:hypothetical protein
MPATTTSRNAACPCGSGQKFKRCCLNRRPRTRPPSAELPHGPHGCEAVLVPAVDPPANSKGTRVWKQLHFSLRSGDTVYRAVVLHSDAWLRQNGVQVGDEALLNLPQARGRAKLLAVFDTAVASDGEGRLLALCKTTDNEPEAEPRPQFPARPPRGKPDPATLRRIHLFLERGEDDWTKAILLRSVDWLEQCGARVGGQIWLELPEMGVRGWAEVREIGPCPELEDGPGCLVTGWFMHSRGWVLALRLRGGDEVLAATRTHPFWSVDRAAWVPLGELRLGERLLGEDGTTPQVESLTPRAGPEPVYNIEVEGDHCYRVGQHGILVHNATHRGRIQAQGGGVEKSVPWNQDCPPTETAGYSMADALEAMLSRREAAERQYGFERLRRFVDNAGRVGGADAVVMISWVTPRTRDIRVDLEIRAGKAFVPD